jgi:nicotinate-nucleotide pyrophosphorylase (carboxylating)
MSTAEIKNFIENALFEDIKDGDHTSLACIDFDSVNEANLIIKDNGIIAGIELAKKIFNIVDKNIEFLQFKNDGEKVKYGEIAFKVYGNSIAILKAERLVLNCMQRMSGIASKTKIMCDIISSRKTKILDTRKTIPLNRFLEKLAVKIGGGENHRFGLYDMIMIKDNHVDFAGGIDKAIINTQKYLSENNLQLFIIVEARNLKEVKEIIKHKNIGRILLDNFSIEETRNAIKIINKVCQTESSGDINEKNIKNYADTGVDYISLGAITHSANNFDLSLKAK